MDVRFVGKHDKRAIFLLRGQNQLAQRLYKLRPPLGARFAQKLMCFLVAQTELVEHPPQGLATNLHARDARYQLAQGPQRKAKCGRTRRDPRGLIR